MPLSYPPAAALALALDAAAPTPPPAARIAEGSSDVFPSVLPVADYEPPPTWWFCCPRVVKGPSYRAIWEYLVSGQGPTGTLFANWFVRRDTSMVMGESVVLALAVED